ncbi:MAG: urate hydroxylase PuuD [Proteobacteria bacterium]|nr:urate hydroxylase PuuD [Pseudomonadota bacterium]
MDVFLSEWANLLIRWAHMLVGIGWIGTSFYFMALDYSLDARERAKAGVLGTAWQVHGGGFYHIEKFTVAPPALPEHLHWFKWEAYLTWVTGFALLIVQYYVNARAYLIDPDVMALQPWQAIAVSIASLAVGWGLYDGLCRLPFTQQPAILALAVFALILGASVFYAHVYSGRGAFVHVGAFIGTIMAVNVFAVIIPGQKKMIAQILAHQAPDARHGIVGKQRSTHNNYLTLPVLVLMVSGHYPFLYARPHSWLVVALIIVGGALLRHYFNRADAGDEWGRYGWTLPLAAFALFAAIYVTAPPAAGTAATTTVSDSEVLEIARKHCVSCHAKVPTHESFREPPKNVVLETLDDLRRYAQPIITQTVQNKAMPLGNQTTMRGEEREKLGAWLRARHVAP